MIKISNKTWVIIIIILTIIAAGFLTWGYYRYIGLPPYAKVSNAYPGKPSPQLDGKIKRLMKEVHAKYPDPKSQNEVESLYNDWLRMEKPPRYKLEYLGLAALPYIEEKTRSTNTQVREIAYDMLWNISATGKPQQFRSDAEQDKEYQMKQKYVNPIWERGLYDPLPNVRYMAIKRADDKYFGPRGIKIYQRMLRDPHKSVRAQAARTLVWGYRRSDLVPVVRWREARYGERE